MTAALVANGQTLRQAATRLEAGHFTFLHKVCTGHREPGLKLAVALERIYGIPVEEWPSLREPVAELLRLRGAA